MNNRWIVKPAKKNAKRKYSLAWAPTKSTEKFQSAILCVENVKIVNVLNYSPPPLPKKAITSSNSPVKSPSSNIVDKAAASPPINPSMVNSPLIEVVDKRPTSSLPNSSSGPAKSQASDSTEAKIQKSSKSSFEDFQPAGLDRRTRGRGKRKAEGEAHDTPTSKRTHTAVQGIIRDEPKLCKGKQMAEVESDVAIESLPHNINDPSEQLVNAASVPSRLSYTKPPASPSSSAIQTIHYQNALPSDPMNETPHPARLPIASYSVNDNHARLDYTTSCTVDLTGDYVLPTSHPIEQSQIFTPPDHYFTNRHQMLRARLHTRVKPLTILGKAASTATEMKVILDCMRRHQRNAKVDLMVIAENHRRT